MGARIRLYSWPPSFSKMSRRQIGRVTENPRNTPISRMWKDSCRESHRKGHPRTENRFACQWAPRKLIFTHKGVIIHKLHVLYFITGRGKSDGENPQQLHTETFTKQCKRKLSMLGAVFFLDLFHCCYYSITLTFISLLPLYKYLFKLFRGTILLFVLEHAVNIFFAINL